MVTTLSQHLAGDLLRIHAIITRGIDTICSWDSLATPGKKLYADALLQIIDLHHHHEDELDFPDFKEREHDFPLKKLHEDHVKLHVLLEQSQEALSTDLDQVIGLMRKVKKLWIPHIKIEEEWYTEEEINKIYTPEEQRTVAKKSSEYAMQHIKEPKKVFPFVLYHLTPEERAIFTKHIPWPVKKIIVPYLWKRSYNAMIPYFPYY